MKQRESQWVLDKLEDIGSYFPAASVSARNLRKLWALKGSYWDATEIVFTELCRIEGVDD